MQLNIHTADINDSTPGVTNSKVLYLIQLEHPMATKTTHSTVLQTGSSSQWLQKMPASPGLLAKVANLNFYSGQDCYGLCPYQDTTAQSQDWLLLP